ncbi:MAG: hypothetical protein QOH56_15 [Pseudonocardiales bacterium]|jgi:hypothetical protein|nr:uridine kinase [Frankiales bacterium]MDQ1733764.1 hypothetical protein [Pseudonocardiales bacterium]
MGMTPEGLELLVAAIARTTPGCGLATLVAIDGGAAAGKTTLAAALAERLPASEVVHTDDLLDGWDDQFGFWPRLRGDVLEPLAAGRAGRYRRYDWAASRFGPEIGVPVDTRTLIIEGVSAIEACGAWADFRILVDVERSERERRWRQRDGSLDANAMRWLDCEDSYFASRRVEADWVIGRPVG